MTDEPAAKPKDLIFHTRLLQALAEQERPDAGGLGQVRRDSVVVKTEDLRAALDEIYGWRQSITCYLQTAIEDVARPKNHPDPGMDWRQSPEQRLKEFLGVLSSALEGDNHPSCESCSKPVRPGQPVVPSEEVGAMHAECVGASPEDIAAGEIWVDPETLGPVEEGDPPLDIRADGLARLGIFIDAPLYSDEAILAMIEKGSAAQAKINAEMYAEDPSEEA